MTSHRKNGWHAFALDTIVFGLAFGLANVASYVFIVVAGRTLPPLAFGVFNALLGILTMAGMLSTSLQVAVTKASAFRGDRSAFLTMMRGLARVIVPSTLVLTLAVMPFAAWVGASWAHVALCGLVILMMFLGVTPLGFLGGRGAVRAQALVNLAGALARLVTGWPLLAIGTGIAGALSAYAVSALSVWVLAYVLCMRTAATVPGDATNALPALRLDGLAICAFALAFAPFTLDQFLVQTIASESGGDYAAASTIAKLVFFGTFPVTAVAYPQMLSRTTDRARLTVLSLASAAVVVISAGLACLLLALPTEVTQLFFGTKFQAAVPHVGTLAIGVACFSVSIVGVHALIAWGTRLAMLPSAATLVAAATLYTIRHASLEVLVWNQFWVFAIQLVLVFGLLGHTIARTGKRARHNVRQVTAS